MKNFREKLALVVIAISFLNITFALVVSLLVYKNENMSYLIVGQIFGFVSGILAFYFVSNYKKANEVTSTVTRELIGEVKPIDNDTANKGDA